MRGCVWLAMLVACGGSEDPAAIDGPGTTDPDAVIDGVNSGIDTPPTDMAISSTVLAEGAAFPEVHTCGTAGDAANTSPPLAWVGPPAGTLSFAVVFTDRIGLIHSVIYDIPATATSLPVDVEKTFAPANVLGAHQTITLGGVTFGYAGPCPPPGAAVHTYEFELFALDVATLPGADMTTTQSQARTLILAHDLASVELTGTYQR
ncbi:MAG: YbhB/YbcL family Raf kinase inhibitor-like protein [Kofleriaceae bacterium]